MLPAVLEMTNSAEPESARTGNGWEDRQPLVPNGAGRLPGEATGSLGRVASMPDQAARPGRVSTSGTPRAPSRFVFGRSRSMHDEAEQPGSSRSGQQGSLFGRWRKSGQYSIAEDQVPPLATLQCSYNCFTGVKEISTFTLRSAASEPSSHLQQVQSL